MKIPSRETVEMLRREYPAGTRVVLHEMDDFQAPPEGTEGTVLGVDDAGDIEVRWDNGVCGLWRQRGCVSCSEAAFSLSASYRPFVITTKILASTHQNLIIPCTG